MSLKSKIYMPVIEKLCDELRKNPDGDMNESVKELLQEIHLWEKIEVQHTLASFFMNLYQRDVAALKRDYCKVIVMGGKDADLNERVNLLRCLHGALQTYYGEDYSDILNLCDEIKEMQDLEQMEGGE